MNSEMRSFKPCPFLKWAGGMSQLLEQMSPFFPKEFNTYLEPFLGGGGVLFHLQPEKTVLSDSKPELMHVYKLVRDSSQELMKALDKHFPNCKSRDYYKVRTQDPGDLDAVERAARTIFLNKTCWIVRCAQRLRTPLQKRVAELLPFLRLQWHPSKSVHQHKACSPESVGIYLDK